MSHPFDYLAIFIIGILAFTGYKRGFLEEIGRLVGLMVSSAVAIRFYGPLSSWLQPRFPSSGPIVPVISFLVIFISLLMFLRFLTGTFQIFMLTKGVQSSNRALGLFFGTMKGVIAVTVMLWVVDIAPNPRYFDHFKKTSYVYRQLPGFRRWVVESFGIEESVGKGEDWVKEKIEPDR